MQLEELRDEEPIKRINEESGGDKRHNVPEESDAGKNFTLKELPEIFYI